MLQPHDRTLLLEALHPPEGYQLDKAIGTTFSLDLLALLTTPIAFSLFEQDPNDLDPLALLHTIQSYADRLTIFCHGGQIKVPDRHQLLYSYLEDSVYEVLPPRQGVFHPKVWVLRYTSEWGVRYRFLCLSRNLTFDRSWDTLLLLEGELTDRTNAYSVNRPIAELLEALPEMALRRVADDRLTHIEQLAYEVQRVDFQPPEHIEELVFWAMGLPRRHRRWPFPDSASRFLIVSPFVSEGLLSEVSDLGREQTLITRSESLDALPSAHLERFARVYALDPNLSADVDEGDDRDPLNDVPLSGLHAKLFIAESGWDASVWTGSANATSAAFNHNVEFMVELRGKKSKIGIDAFLGDEEANTTTFRHLLRQVTNFDAPSTEDATRQQLEADLRALRRELTAAGLALHAEPHGEDYRLTLKAAVPVNWGEGFTVQAWPITVNGDNASLLPAAFEQVSLGLYSTEALSAFLALRLTAEQEGQTLTTEFVLNVPLTGVTVDRQSRIVRAILQNPEQVMRFLMMLLAEDSYEALDLFTTDAAGGQIALYDGVGGALQIPLLETMLRSLARNPASIDRVAQLVHDLRQVENGRSLLPPNFDAIWQPIWEARQRMEPSE